MLLSFVEFSDADSLSKAEAGEHAVRSRRTCGKEHVTGEMFAFTVRN
jgi:hypothetical protein